MRTLGLLLALWFVIVADVHGQQPATPASYNEISITVLKTAHQLWLYKGKEPIKVYRVFLGSSPEGHKRTRGDNRTPEGNYRVIEKNPDSKFHRFITIDYPNVRDADLAYNEGRLSASQWVDILYASTKGVKPPWNTSLGGFLGIHGIGDDEKFKLELIGDMDWTNGCIALTNRDVEELFRRVPVGTLVRIRR